MGKGPIANVFEAAFFLQRWTSLLFHLGHCSLKSAALSTQTFIIFHLRLCYGSVELLATVVALPVDLLLFLRHPFDVIISESCQDPHHQIQIRPIHDTFCSWFWLPIVCKRIRIFPAHMDFECFSHDSKSASSFSLLPSVFPAQFVPEIDSRSSLGAVGNPRRFIKIGLRVKVCPPRYSTPRYSDYMNLNVFKPIRFGAEALHLFHN